MCNCVITTMTSASKQEPGESKFKPQEKRAAELKEIRNSMSSKLLSLLVFTRNKLPSRALPPNDLGGRRAGGRTTRLTHAIWEVGVRALHHSCVWRWVQCSALHA